MCKVAAEVTRRWGLTNHLAPHLLRPSSRPLRRRTTLFPWGAALLRILLPLPRKPGAHFAEVVLVRTGECFYLRDELLFLVRGGVSGGGGKEVCGRVNKWGVSE